MPERRISFTESQKNALNILAIRPGVLGEEVRANLSGDGSLSSPARRVVSAVAKLPQSVRSAEESYQSLRKR